MKQFGASGAVIGVGGYGVGFLEMENRMQVWRMETENSLGPYRGDHNSEGWCPIERAFDMAGADISSANCPTPRNDDTLMKNIRQHQMNDWGDYLGWHFGFASLDQYFVWIPEAQIRTRLREEGVHLVAYEVAEEHCCLGDTQVIFRKNQAELLSVLDCDFEEQKELAFERKVA